MFERKGEKLIPPRRFFRRLLKSLAWAALVIAASLFIGVAGYNYLENLPWIDALLNASMILGGMGPVDPMKTDAGKLFATFYALYSGIAFLTMMAVMVAPVFHRILHTFHLEQEEAEATDESDDSK